MRETLRRHSCLGLWIVAVTLLPGLIGGCSTQQMIGSEAIAVMDTVAWSPDGKQIAAGRNIFNVIFLYDSADLRRTAVLSSEQQDTWGRIRARSIAYSADGRYLAVAANDQPVVIWDLKSNTEALRLGGLHDASLIAFSPKDNILAAAGPENRLTLWTIPQGRHLASLPHPSQVMSLAFSVDGQLLATGGADHNARIWRLADLTLVAQLLRHDYPVTGVAFSPDNMTLAAYAGSVTLWESFKGAVDLKLPKPDTRWLRTMQFAALLSGMSSISMGGGPGVHVPGDATAGKRGMEQSVEHRLPVLFSGDGRFLAVMRSSQTFSGSNEILVIHRETEKTVSLRCNCFSMAFSPDSDKLIAVGTKLILWDPLTGRQLAEH